MRSTVLAQALSLELTITSPSLSIGGHKLSFLFCTCLAINWFYYINPVPTHVLFTNGLQVILRLTFACHFTLYTLFVQRYAQFNTYDIANAFFLCIHTDHRCTTEPQNSAHSDPDPAHFSPEPVCCSWAAQPSSSEPQQDRGHSWALYQPCWAQWQEEAAPRLWPCREPFQ